MAHSQWRIYVMGSVIEAAHLSVILIKNSYLVVEMVTGDSNGWFQ